MLSRSKKSAKRFCLIIGAGHFGISLASQISLDSDNIVYLFVRDCDVANYIIKHSCHPTIFPDYKISCEVFSVWEDVPDNVDIIFLCTQSTAILDVTNTIPDIIKSNKPIIVLCAKGLANDRFCPFYSDHITRIIPESKVVTLSGPTFADEIIAGYKAILLLASIDNHAMYVVKELFRITNIDIRCSNDIYIVQIIGALKNIMAINAGIYTSLMLYKYKQIHYNALCAMMLEMLEEINGVSKYHNYGSCVDVLYSPAGIGDIILTCMSNKSRNNKFGLMLGHQLAILDTKDKDSEYDAVHKIIDDILSSDDMIIEGYNNIAILYQISSKSNIVAKHISSLFHLLYKFDVNDIYFSI